MSMCKALLLLSILGVSSVTYGQQGPELGVEATSGQIAAWDISIEPNGEGLPPGSGTAAEGEAIYETKCMACHGSEGSGKPNNRLVGGHGSLKGPAPVRTVGSFWPYATTVFDYIRRAMPYPYSGSLEDQEVYALTAYLLFLNEIIEEGLVMDADTLPQVKMPNRNNFLLAYPHNPEKQ